jgi:O-antigen ligase
VISVAEDRRLDRGSILFHLALVGMCATTGIAAAVKPALGIELALGLAAVVFVMTSVFAGLVLFTLVSFLEVASLNNSALSAMKAIGLVLFLSWLLRATAGRRGEIASLLRSHRPILLAGAAFVAWSALSALWAQSPGVAGSSTLRYLENFLLLPIVLSTVTRRKHVVWIAAAFVVGGLAAALYGFASPQPVSSRDFGRLTATNLDANGLALALAVAVTFAAALLATARGRPLLRWSLALSIGFGLVGIFATQSRSGVISLVTMLVAAALFGGRWRRHAVVVLILAATAGGVYLAVAPPTSTSHVTSSDTAGRTDLWTVALRMFDSHPMVGVGSGNFPVSSVDYVSRPGDITRADLIVDTPLATHNVYLQLLAEVGIPGLLAFVSLFVVAAGSALRAAARFARARQTELELLARYYVCVLAGLAASDFFLPNQFLKQFWLLIALGPALLAIARRGSAGPRPVRSRAATPARTFTAGRRSPAHVSLGDA